jgi:hypothetical protein
MYQDSDPVIQMNDYIRKLTVDKAEMPRRDWRDVALRELPLSEGQAAYIRTLPEWNVGKIQEIVGRNPVETGKHPSIAQQADIVERRFYSLEQVANCDLCSIHSVTCKRSFLLGGVQGRGKFPPPASRGRCHLGLY